ncbi:MAG: TIGR03435 family protein, partial [Acidobacteriota bacterium]|nr:TIGR03435 family protein [Acidobacteriota bacterium]
MKYLLLLWIVAAAPLIAFAQTFTVASIRPNLAGNRGGEGMPREAISFDPVTLNMEDVTLKSCIRWAYGLGDYEVAGPDWIGVQRYDVRAKADPPASPEQLRLMLQRLLAARFGLRLHREQRNIPVYELVTEKGRTKLKSSGLKSSGEAETKQMGPGDGDLLFQHYSMADLAESLPGIPFRVDRVVVDKTGLEGTYDFRLRIAGNAQEMKSSFEHGDTISADDILKQIGLRLTARKEAIGVTVVDSAQ